MSRLWARFSGLLSNRKFMGTDKAGNQYFSRYDKIDGSMKEKRWVIFKVDEDPTTIPVEWICWLNGQRKKAPTVEEMAELEARRETVRLNVARLKEEEEKKAREGKPKSKAAGPDLKAFIRQLRPDDKDTRVEEASDLKTETSDRSSRKSQEQRETPESTSEPSGSGPSFRPGTWQPPT